jgi:hypothetical protein
MSIVKYATKLVSVANITLAATVAILLPSQARATINIYPCCTALLTSCCGPCNYPAPWYCWDQYLACEAGPYPGNCNAPCTGCPIRYNCLPCIEGTTMISYQFLAPSYLIGTNLLSHSQLGPATGYAVVTGSGTMQPLHLSVGAWNGTNVISTGTAGGVDFYTIATSDLVASSTGTNAVGTNGVPWAYAGSGVLDTNSGMWETTWTPPDYQSYVIDAEVYDPSVTHGMQGPVTNGVVSLVTLAGAAPAKPEIITPVLTSDGRFAVRVIGPPASTCTVQVSSNLKTWRSVVTITNFTGVAQIIDASGIMSKNFYQAVSSP